MSIETNLFDNIMVKIHPQAAEIGGAWSHGPGNSISTERAGIKFIYERSLHFESPIFMDIGANTGSYSLLPKANPSMFCYAFEPMPTSYEFLNINIALNGLQDKVKTFLIALADKAETGTLKYPNSGKESGLATLGDPTLYHSSAKEWAKIQVPVRTLDSIAIENGISRVDIIKIDTEGCELLVLKGGEKLIMDCLPEIMLEYEGTTAMFGYDCKDITCLLESWGYNKVEAPGNAYFVRRRI